MSYINVLGFALKKTDGCRTRLQSGHMAGKDGLIWTQSQSNTEYAAGFYPLSEQEAALFCVIAELLH